MDNTTKERNRSKTIVQYLKIPDSKTAAALKAFRIKKPDQLKSQLEK